MKKLLVLIMTLITACSFFVTTAFVSANSVDPVFDKESITSEITLEKANAEGSVLKKAFDYWNNNTITFTEKGVLSTSSGTDNVFNLLGLFPVKGAKLELEIGIPLFDKDTNTIIDENKEATNMSIVLFKGVTGKTEEVAKITIWGDGYSASKDYVAANIYVGPNGSAYAYEQGDIKLPKAVLEDGGYAKIGFSIDDGFYFEGVDGNYLPLAMNDNYKSALDNLGIEEITRIQVVKGPWCKDQKDNPTAILKSVNGQSFIPTNGKLTITDLWSTSKIKLTTKKFVIGENYTFSLNTSGTNNNVLSEVKPADTYMLFFSNLVGNVGWNLNGSAGSNVNGGVYVTVTDPNGNSTTTAYNETWGHPGSKAINFKFDKYGENTLTISVVTNKGYTLTKKEVISVEPKIELLGEATKDLNGIVLPNANLIVDETGATIPATFEVKMFFGETEIVKTNGAYPVTENGTYVAKYVATLNGAEYVYEYEIFYDGNAIMTKKIEPNFMFTDNAVFQQGKKVKIFGTGGDNGATVKVEYDNQVKTGVIENNVWEVYLDEMDYNDGKTLKITYGGQIIEYSNVAVGEVFLCGGQSNMQVNVNYIWGKNASVETDYKTYGNDFSKVSVFLVPGGKSSQKETTLSANTKWVNLTDFNSSGAYSAYAVAFAQNLTKMTGIKVGVIVSAIGGSAIEQWLEADSFNRVPDRSDSSKNKSELFNAMINPILNYEIGGILFYQGETNAWSGAVKDYFNQQLEYVDSYRKMFRDENLPIVLTQLVQWNGSFSFVECRDSQWQVMFARENVYTVSAIDTGDATNDSDNIHPSDKWKVGGKAAGLVADKVLGIAYNDLLEKPYYGVAPYLESAVEVDGVITVKVANATFLNSQTGNLVMEAYYDGAWHDIAFTVARTEIKINTDGKEITKLRYLQYDYVPNGQALVFNEYNNAIAPCKELVIGQKYTVTILDTENGSVSVTPNGELTFGTEVTITATPNQGYKVKEIKVNGQTINGNTFTVSKDSTVLVTFELIETVPENPDNPENPENPNGGEQNPPADNNNGNVEEPEKSGCKGNILSASITLLPILALASIVMLKKKER